MNIRKKLNLSYVPRWTIVPMMRNQSVADHSWRVAVIAEELAARLVPTRAGSMDSFVIIYRALNHDVTEAMTGDIPASIKTPPAPPEDPYDLLVKVADVIETRTWLVAWGHPSFVVDILDDNDPKFRALLDALESLVEGGRKIALDLERDIRWEDRNAPILPDKG